jgi:cysteine desulfurase / selenocysteine lyase
MNTATPTGDGGTAAAPWPPDEATLTRMANEFFAQFPGQPATAAPGHEQTAVASAYGPAPVAPGYQPPIVSAGLVTARPERPGQ